MQRAYNKKFYSEEEQTKCCHRFTPDIAKTYYGLREGAKLRDVVVAVREDERGHAQENHRMADVIKESK